MKSTGYLVMEHCDDYEQALRLLIVSRYHSRAWLEGRPVVALLQKMAEHDNENLTPDEFVEILKSLGYRDCTTYENPYGPSKANYNAGGYPV